MRGMGGEGEDCPFEFNFDPATFKVGDTVMAGTGAEIRSGNSLPIANIPVGTLIHNIEIKEGRGGQMVRSAGGAAQLLAKEGDFAQVRMPSGEVRSFGLPGATSIGSGTTTGGPA